MSTVHLNDIDVSKIVIHTAREVKTGTTFRGTRVYFGYLVDGADVEQLYIHHPEHTHRSGLDNQNNPHKWSVAASMEAGGDAHKKYTAIQERMLHLIVSNKDNLGLGDSSEADIARMMNGLVSQKQRPDSTELYDPSVFFKVCQKWNSPDEFNCTVVDGNGEELDFRPKNAKELFPGGSKTEMVTDLTAFISIKIYPGLETKAMRLIKGSGKSLVPAQWKAAKVDKLFAAV